MTLGSGYAYLMSSVARADEARVVSGLTAYYAASGTPPGRFLGAGLAGLAGGTGIAAGSPVSEEQLWRMLGMLQDPLTGDPLGRPPVPDRAQLIGPTGRIRKAARTVAGFDLTFSAPKSVSVVWALGDEATRERIHAAHRAAIEDVIAYAERHVFATRTGAGGLISQDVRGVVAAAFDHWDSRAGDPQLHTHVVVLNRVQAVSDGGWRTLDSKALFRATVGLSELYNAVLADRLSNELGWVWEPRQRARSAAPAWEVAGVPEALLDEFSQRAHQIEAATEDLVEGFVTSHGRRPSTDEVLRLRQQATLSTRPEKQRHSLHDLIAGWRVRAERIIGHDGPGSVHGLACAAIDSASRQVGVDHAGIGAAAERTLASVGWKRSVFTRANVFAEAVRQLHGQRFTTAADRVAAVEDVTGLVLDAAVRLTPDDHVESLPAEMVRADGSSRFRPRDGVTFTTKETLAAEEALVDAGRATDGPLVGEVLAEAAVAAPLPGSDTVLGPDQAAAVVAVVSSGRALDVLVGAAGTGKSTAMAGVRAAWESVYGAGSVVGLAPSAAAAEVLGDAVGVATENTAKWLTEHDRQPQREAELARLDRRLRYAAPSLRTRALQRRRARLDADHHRWGLAPGQLVIVDEASMACTTDLHRITTAARAAHAKVLLVGDPRQLSPVQAGGAFALLVADRGHTPELGIVRRFQHEWEREASLHLRAGRRTSIDTYHARGRITGGPRDEILDRLYAAWRADIDTGRTAIMIAADATTVAELNSRARADRVASGLVGDGGVITAHGTLIGVGDVVVTRRNNRDLTIPGGWVKNGDTWTVSALRPDGSATLTRPGRAAGAPDSVELPAAYVADHLDLGYAMTAHRAQGRTVDVAHAYISATTTREPLYVMATRGREANLLYVDTTSDPDHATLHEDLPETDPVAVLREVLASSGADITAVQTRRHEAEADIRPRQVAAEGAALQALARERRYTTALLATGHREHAIEAAKEADQWRPLLAKLAMTERAGLDPASAADLDRSARSLADLDHVLDLWLERVRRQSRVAGSRHRYLSVNGTRQGVRLEA
ncbi:MobF family relaxase [Nostocoides sp. HKS02]|uniref:MobF family relaxase n=1 Tax=Nostocoides sp. HKS02 TaxID=1813880 RepID=UPI0012B473ED|nr:MobF family relaxase [Tetrasphaera sp. HKS02]QGN58837.1 relaxase domain-containing protein [Tetrasphaera sp. HKS02]